MARKLRKRLVAAGLLMGMGMAAGCSTSDPVKSPVARVTSPREAGIAKVPSRGPESSSMALVSPYNASISPYHPLTSPYTVSVPVVSHQVQVVSAPMIEAPPIPHPASQPQPSHPVASRAVEVVRTEVPVSASGKKETGQPFQADGQARKSDLPPAPSKPQIVPVSCESVASVPSRQQPAIEPADGKVVHAVFNEPASAAAKSASVASVPSRQQPAVEPPDGKVVHAVFNEPAPGATKHDDIILAEVEDDSHLAVRPLASGVVAVAYKEPTPEPEKQQSRVPAPAEPPAMEPPSCEVRVLAGRDFLKVSPATVLNMPSGERSPKVNTKNVRFGHSANYACLTGELRYIESRGLWRLRFAPVDAEDPYGGTVTLLGEHLSSDYKDGQIVQVEGRLINPEEHENQAPYWVQSIHLLKPAPTGND